MEGILQKLKRSITGSYWKQHWVVASLEFDEFLQFNSASNPSLPQDTVPDTINGIKLGKIICPLSQPFIFVLISTEVDTRKSKWKESPKYAFILSKCTVEEYFDKKYSFTITESVGSSSRSMTFAADSFLSYERWIRLLMHHTSSDPQSGISNLQSISDEGRNEEEGSVGSEDFKFVKSDAIADYFFQPVFSQAAVVSHARSIECLLFFNCLP